MFIAGRRHPGALGFSAWLKESIAKHLCGKQDDDRYLRQVEGEA
jgi:hypothetical protein